MTNIRITFKPKQVASRLVSVIENDRAQDVLKRRYGLTTNTSVETLESVGQSYGITRERVRQIENHAIKAIQKSDQYKEFTTSFKELSDAIDALGGIAPQGEFLSTLAKSQVDQNHLLFLLTVGEGFNKKKEGGDYVHHWYLDEAHAKSVRDAISNLHSTLTNEIVLPEDEIVSQYQAELSKAKITQEDSEKILRWLSISKKIARNPLGEWGRSTSPSVRVKGMRDFAYLTLKRNGSPLHFSEVAKQVESLFGRKAHVATTHNELIKDARFVLVGRGLYALSEWGYSKGVVKDVIRELLEKNGSMTRKDIIDMVKRERYVKDNTITVNLQDTDTFTHQEDDTYSLV